MITFFLKKYKKCQHKQLTPFSTGDFCPDCGQEVEITWLILRCKCCNNKRKAHLYFNSITSKDKYCTKCGTSDSYVEKKETLEFFDYEYAIISKKILDNALNNKEVLQIWIEKEENQGGIINNLKLIPLLTRYTAP